MKSILGISAFYHDSAATILIDGKPQFNIDNEGIDSIEDAEKVINEQRLEMQADADKVQNEDKFKADLRASWV